jgi:copper homeostasis protein
MKHLELACFSLKDALRAAELGVHRIEFCQDYNTGGITPNLEDFKVLRQRFPGILIHVMIRPRAGNFIHTENEIDVMNKQIEDFYQFGADGFVFGILMENNTINTLACQQLINAAKEKKCVFHRAFDAIENSRLALEQLIELGFSGVLSSGCLSNALDGFESLKSLYAQAQNRIQIVAGGGIRSTNIGLLLRSDLDWFHSAAWDKESQVLNELEIREMLRKVRDFND